MKTINRYTRAGVEGKMIACPHCHRSTTVYHFAWSALMCQHCKTPVEKYDWAIACDCTSRGIGEGCRTRQRTMNRKTRTQSQRKKETGMTRKKKVHHG